jgi:hypothetical protein
MLALSILLFLAGAVFAHRFRVYAIVPLCCCAFVGGLTFPTTDGLFLRIASAFMLVAVPQIGYVMGLISRWSLASQRIPRHQRPQASPQEAN